VEFYRPVKKPLTVPIVPLIDILVSLLFFFIVSMNEMERKRPRPVMKVNLPTADSIKVKTISSIRTVLSLNTKGTAEIDGLVVPDGFLKEYLIANREQRPNLKLELRIDEGCPHGVVLKALGAAIKAGYDSREIVHRARPDKESTEKSN